MKVLSYPNKCAPGHKLRDYLNFLNYEITNDINDNNIDIVFHWDYRNISKVSKEVKELKKPVINQHLLNVKKDYVNEVFKRTFGYSLFVNPTEFSGYCIKKSTRQAIHDAIIIKCPITQCEYAQYHHHEKTTFGDIEHTYTYQRIIDNRIFNTDIYQHFQDYQLLRDNRVLIVNNKIKAIIFKDKNCKNMFEPNIFGNCADKQKIRSTLKLLASYTFDIDSIFTKDEQKNILVFCKDFGIEFADLDILRDNSTGLIYIVDVNNIAANGVFNKLTQFDKLQVVEKVANELKTLINEKI